MELTKEHLIEIAKAGFPEYIWENIKDNPMDVFHISEVYYLYNTDAPIEGIVPKHYYVSLAYDKENNYVQFNPKYRKFNEYTAIKKMEELRLIGNECELQDVEGKNIVIKSLEQLLEHIKEDEINDGYCFEMRKEQGRDFETGELYTIREFVVCRNEYFKK